MADLQKYAVLDVETRGHVELARAVLGLAPDTPPDAVWQRLQDQRRSENGSAFPKLPYHVPAAAAVLLVDREPTPDGDCLRPVAWSCWREDESSVCSFLERFFELVEGRICVGFNSQGFDLPLLELWASRYRVRTAAGPAEAPRPHVDLQKALACGARGAGSLDELCKFHALPGKPGVSGEQVESLLAQGRLDEVHAYNVTDVLQTYLLFLHAELRAGRASRATAAASARQALELTARQVLAALPQGSASRALLGQCLAACQNAPLLSAL